MVTAIEKLKMPPLVAKLLANSKQALFAAVEIHNKPVFSFRYEVCTLLAINAWELLLKAFIAANLPEVKLMAKDGTTKPFLECVGCIASTIGKDFQATSHNLELLYQYRNSVAHFCIDDLDIVVLGLLKASVLFFARFAQTHFGLNLQDETNLVLLPIGFTRPVSPLDFISNKSGAEQCSPESKAFLNSMKDSAQKLQEAGIEESVVVNFSIALMNESRIKNADLTAAIDNSVPQGNIIAIRNVISAANLSNDPAAKQVRLDEESIFREIFTETYNDVAQKARTMFADFSQNAEFNGIMRKVKQNPNLMRSRVLNPKNPRSARQEFYSKQVYDELAKHYKRFKK